MINCDYHPTEIAVSKCERCHRNICLNDKRVYRKTRGTHEHRYTETYEYCPICYSDATVTDSRNSAIGGIFFIAFVMIMFSSFTGSVGIVAGTPFNFIFILILLIIIFSFIGTLSNASKAKAQQRAFLNSLQQLPQGVYPTSRGFIPDGLNPRKQSTVQMECFQCGYKLELQDRFCPSCGDSTEDEKKAYKVQ